LIQENRDSRAPIPNDRPLVTSGYVIVPASPAGLTIGKDWRKEKMPTVLFRQGYRDRFNMGAMVLRPGTDLSAIAKSLSAMIGATIGSPLAHAGPDELPDTL
jgi:hypothetical protein